MENVHRYIDENFDDCLEQIRTILSQPSVTMCSGAIEKCADHLAHLMREAGIDASIYATPGNPIVYGELLSKNPRAKTVLFYGHYDVQPPDPLDLWDSPPFEPTLREGRLFARGAADNKGQLMTHLLAIRAFRAMNKEIPSHVKLLFEGEEESGSPSLETFIETHKKLLACDVVLPVDGSMFAEDIVAVHLRSRGIVEFEIELQTARTDNHSGFSGGVIPSAGWALVDLLKTMRDEKGNILIDGFMDRVRPPSDFEMSVIEALPFNAAVLSELYGAPVEDMGPVEFFTRLNLSPTLTINGITCGYQGKGSKTINPGKASAKLDARLVFDQDPADIVEKITNHVARHAPDAKVTVHCTTPPSKSDGGQSICQSVFSALRKIYGEGVVAALGSGGTIPNYVWTRILEVPALGIPYANADANNHAPNENIKVDLIRKGIHASAQIMHDLAE